MLWTDLVVTGELIQVKGLADAVVPAIRSRGAGQVVRLDAGATAESQGRYAEASRRAAAGSTRVRVRGRVRGGRDAQAVIAVSELDFLADGDR